MMNAHIPIIIQEVGNGFIVVPNNRYPDCGVVSVSDKETLVFADITSLIRFVECHFTTIPNIPFDKIS